MMWRSATPANTAFCATDADFGTELSGKKRHQRRIDLPIHRARYRQKPLNAPEYNNTAKTLEARQLAARVTGN